MHIIYLQGNVRNKNTWSDATQRGRRYLDDGGVTRVYVLYYVPHNFRIVQEDGGRRSAVGSRIFGLTREVGE